MKQHDDDDDIICQGAEITCPLTVITKTNKCNDDRSMNGVQASSCMCAFMAQSAIHNNKLFFIMWPLIGPDHQCHCWQCPDGHDDPKQLKNELGPTPIRNCFVCCSEKTHTFICLGKRCHMLQFLGFGGRRAKVHCSVCEDHILSLHCFALLPFALHCFALLCNALYYYYCFITLLCIVIALH